MRKILILLALCAYTVIAGSSYAVETRYDAMDCGGKIQHVVYYPTYCNPSEENDSGSQYWQCDMNSGTASLSQCDSKKCSKKCSVTAENYVLSQCDGQGLVFDCANDITNYTSPGMHC